jgi:hypothetical protein
MQMPYHCVEKIERALNDAGKSAKGTRVAISASPTRRASATCASHRR